MSQFDFSAWSPLGFGEFFASSFQTMFDPAAARRPARVIAASREIYRVAWPGEGEAWLESPARPAGRLRRAGELPVVGDWVAAEPGDPVVIRERLPRRTRISRKVAGERSREQVVAANVDVVFLVMGLDGDFNLHRLERFLVMAWESGATPAVILTKADLCPSSGQNQHGADLASRLESAMAHAPGAPVFAVSALAGEGLEALAPLLAPGLTLALIGSSGVGKSTLINKLAGRELARTGEVRAGDDRGRHTTTHRELFRLPSGALLIDNPGIRELQLWAGEGALGETFDEIAELAAACRFPDCRHRSEPGCAVAAALEDGHLDPGRLEHHRQLERELRHLELRQDVARRRQLERGFGLMARSAQRDKGRRRGE